MAKICFNTLKIIVVKYDEIWFPWQNMVLCFFPNNQLLIYLFYMIVFLYDKFLLKIFLKSSMTWTFDLIQCQT